MRFVPLDELKGNEILGVNVINGNMQILVQAGTRLNTRLIDRIRKYGIQSVYIQHEFNEILKGTITDTIEPMVRNQSVSQVKKSFEVFENKVKQQKSKSRYNDSGNELYTSIKNISGDLIDAVLTAKNIEVAMQDIKTVTEYHYQHSVNVAVLSLILGVEIGLSSAELENLAYGALLIDCGCQWIDEELLLKEAIYTPEEFEEMKSHVVMGYNHLNENSTFNAHVKSIIMHHHERNDGSGYPKGLGEKDIHDLAKIVMIADVYDALTSDRPHRKAHTQHEALEYIMANAGKKFDFKLVNTFARKIVPYPVGSFVQLSNKQKGVVTENNKSHPLRPVVRTFGKSAYTGTNDVSVNLLTNNNITIKKIIYSID